MNVFVSNGMCFKKNYFYFCVGLHHILEQLKCNTYKSYILLGVVFDKNLVREVKEITNFFYIVKKKQQNHVVQK